MEKSADSHAFILNFIKQHQLAVISTVSQNNEPESAVIGFGETDILELIFGTSHLSRKYQNLRHNPKVSFVIGWDHGQTVQYEGTARELSGDEAGPFKQLYFAKSPASRKHEHLPDERYFVVSPCWVRHTGLTQEPWGIIELSINL